MTRKIGIIFDMDGVIYRGSEPIKGARELIEFLKAKKIPFLFLTNNSTRDPAMYREKLLSMSIDVPEEVIITSGLATRLYMERHFEPGDIFVIGGKGGLLREMERLGWGGSLALKMLGKAPGRESSTSLWASTWANLREAQVRNARHKERGGELHRNQPGHDLSSGGGSLPPRCWGNNSSTQSINGQRATDHRQAQRTCL